jgi:hypothetical protein
MFSDFPDNTAFISQECSVEDVWMEVTTNGMAGLANLCEARLRIMQQELSDLLKARMLDAAKSKGFAGEPVLEHLLL